MPDRTDAILLDQLHAYADGLESCVSSVSADDVLDPDGRPWAPPPRPRSSRRGRLLWVASAAALVLVVVGVVAIARQSTGDDHRAADGSSPMRGDELRDALTGRTWVSTSVLEHGDPYPLLDEDGAPGGQLTLQFRARADGRRTITWFAGCNWSTSEFEIDGDRLVLPDGMVAVTQRGCPSSLAAQDSMWHVIVSRRPMLWLDDGVLTLLGGDQYRVELVDGSTRPDVATPEVPSLAQLDGREFRTGTITEDGTSRPVLPSSLAEDRPGSLLLQFRDGQVFVAAGCNSGRRPLRIDGGRLVGAGITTEMGCPIEQQAQDDWLEAFFGSSPSIRLAGSRLFLSTDTASIELTEPVDGSGSGSGSGSGASDDRPLVGTRWNLDVARSVPGFPADFEGMFQVFLVFEGTDAAPVSGNDGCNRLGGTVTVEGDRIDIVTVHTTEVGCTGPIGTVASTMDAVLSGESRFAIAGDELRITNGSATLTFVAG